jgi:alpha-1,6-mannosyltransferase
MRSPFFRLSALGVALLSVAAVGLLLNIPLNASGADLVRVDIMVALMMAAAAIYFVTVRLVLQRAWPHQTIWMVIAVAVLSRALLLTAPPFLSSDIYRYVWDGCVQAAGINPYRYVPADPALARLRDTAIYPNINRVTYARTIYPPVAQMVFAAVGRIWDSVTGMRLTMLGFEALGIVCALNLLSLAGLPRERILIYAWNPLPLWAFASDGHVDAIVVGLLGAALLLRARHRDGWTGAVLAGAVLAKFLPLVMAPAFLRGGRFWRPPLAGAAVIAVGYGLYLDAGPHVLGFLHDYGEEEGLASGTGIWLLAALDAVIRLPPGVALVYGVAVAAAFLGITIAILRRPAPGDDTQALCRDAGLLAAAAMMAISPHYYWYFAWLALPAVIAPSRALLWLATAPLLLVIGPIPHDQFIWRSLVYVPATLLLLADLRPRLTIKFRRRVGLGDTVCPLRLP